MGHNDIPYHDENNIVHECDVEEDDVQEQHDDVNAGIISRNDPVWQRLIAGPSFQERVYYSHMTAPPWNQWISRHLQAPFHHGRMLRPPPIGIRIPIDRLTHTASPKINHILVGYRGRRSPLHNNRVRPFSDRRRKFRKNIPPPQPRFRIPSFHVCLSRLSPQRQHRLSRSSENHNLHGNRPRSSAMDVASQPKPHVMHRKSRRPRYRRCWCKMNRVYIDVTLNNDQQQDVKIEEEEEDDDDDGKDKLNVCEAYNSYKDLHYDNDSDDDDYFNVNALSDLKIVC